MVRFRTGTYLESLGRMFSLPKPIYDALLSSSIGFATVLASIPALGAELMTIAYGPFEVSVPLAELEAYAETGKMGGDLARYARLFSPEQQADLRQALNQRVDMSPTLVSQLAYSKTGDTVLKRLGNVIKSQSSDNGWVALRATVVQAAASPEGLTLLNLLRKFPTREVQVDVQAGIQIATEVTALLDRGNRMVAVVEAEAQREAQAESMTELTTELTTELKDLRQPGPFRWQTYRFELKDERPLGNLSRNRTIPLDVYLPQGLEAPAPVALISHGMGSNRQTLAYLAEHLASHGIAIAMPEHVGSNASKFQQFLDGVASAPEPREVIDRPLDLSFVLDHLAALEQTDSRFQNQLNLEQVTAIGQSLGGYSVLTLGGAELNFAALNQACINGEPRAFLNFSLLLQCRIAELQSVPTQFRDPRIRAVLAINPFTSRVFHQAGLEKVAVPTMLVASSADFVVPPSEEQLQPFTWLQIPERYLVVMRNATHFSMLEPPTTEERGLPLPTGLEGPDLKLTQGYLSALALAFVKHHGQGDPSFAPYLSATYATQLSQTTVPLSLVKTLSPDALMEAAQAVAEP